MKLSVHIVSCGRIHLLKDCIKSVMKALINDSEVWVIVNGQAPNTTEYLKSLNDSRIKWIEVERESLSRARNRAFLLCRGEIIYFLDDDVVVPSHLFKSAMEYFKLNPKVALTGGPNLTPPDSESWEKIFGGIMGSVFAAPMVRSRYSVGEEINQNANEHQFIFCNLAFRSNAIPMGIRFREDFISNQENLFIYLCKKQGLECAVNPLLYVYHRRRKNIRSFLSQIASYGYGRFQQTAASPLSSHPLFWIPALTVLLLVFLLISNEWKIISCLFGIYSMGAFVGSAQSSDLKKAGFRAILAGTLLTAPLHLFYALGWLRGLIDFLNVSKSKKRMVFGHQQNLSVAGIWTSGSTKN